MHKTILSILPALALWSLAAARETRATASTEAPVLARNFVLAAGSHSKKSDEAPPCPATFDDSPSGNGIYKIGKDPGVTPPKPILTVEATPSDRARVAVRNKETDQMSFHNVVDFVVDKEGNPIDLCILKSAPYGLDTEAAKAVRQYRFQPASKDGVPVPVRIDIVIKFRFY